jgi:hypothetical protein
MPTTNRATAPTSSQINLDLDTPSPQPIDQLREDYLAKRAAHENLWHAERAARDQARAARRALQIWLEADAADQIGRVIHHATMGTVTIVAVGMGRDCRLYPLVRRRRFKTSEVALFDLAFDHETREWQKAPL